MIVSFFMDEPPVNRRLEALLRPAPFAISGAEAALRVPDCKFNNLRLKSQFYPLYYRRHYSILRHGV